MIELRHMTKEAMLEIGTAPRPHANKGSREVVIDHPAFVAARRIVAQADAGSTSFTTAATG